MMLNMYITDRMANIRMAAYAFCEAEKQMAVTNIPLTPTHINATMRYANMVMSEDKIQDWLERYSAWLYWRESYKSEVKLNPLAKSKQDKYMVMYPHEFLFLVCNAINRNEYVLFLS